jgi:uracil-DNA glycosylase family 4
LVAYREQVAQAKRKGFEDWEYWGRPVPGHGDPNARLVIIGLAPAAHGANRTGRMFTGDASARFLMRVLHQAGFASQPTSEHRQDGLALRDIYLTAALRCAPPKDRPLGDELANCSPYLEQELRLLSHVKVVLALGHVAFRAALQGLTRIYGVEGQHRFAHKHVYQLGSGAPRLVASYHPSPRNTLTGKLQEKDLIQLLQKIQQWLEPAKVSLYSGGSSEG